MTDGLAGESSPKKVYEAGDAYPLRYPLELKDKGGTVVDTVTELVFRRLKGVDLTAIANAAARGQGEALKCIVCLAASIPPSTYDKLDAEDLTEVGAIAAGFTGAALSIGVK